MGSRVLLMPYDAIAARTPTKKRGDGPLLYPGGLNVQRGARPRPRAGANRMFKAQGSGLYLPKGLPGMPYDPAKAFTFSRRESTPAWPSNNLENVTSFLSGAEAWIVFASWTASWSMSATASKSFSFRPRVVMAGAPILTPPGKSAETSPGTAFLFSVIWQTSQIFSIFEPVTPSGFKSQSTKWLSVPPVASL